jgi:DNA primase
MTVLLDMDALREAHPLPAVVGNSLKLMRAGNEWKACCPFHADRSPSFTIFAGGRRFYCFGCGAGGDVVDFIRLTHRVNFRDAAAILGENRSLPVVSRHAPEPEPEADRTQEALSIWRNAAPIPGTPAETYLRNRGLRLRLPDSLRFARLRYGKRGREYPCLVACVGSIENKVIGIQRTYLAADGSGKADVPKAKLSLGCVRGGAIRLAPAAAQLTVTEGLEDGLTLQQELGRAVWVAAGSTMLPKMLFPAGVNAVAIGGDGDEPGVLAARNAAEAYAERGIKARYFFPMEGFKDFNAELMGARS